MTQEYDVWFELQVFDGDEWVTTRDYDTLELCEADVAKFGDVLSLRVVKRRGIGRGE